MSTPLTSGDANGGGAAGPPAIAALDIVKRFPGVVANDGVTFTLERGEVHALLGENGAGKSTLSNIITGLYRQDAGELRIDGELVAFRSPRDAIERGIAMVHQQFRLIPTFTVAENVLLGERGSVTINPRAMETRVRELGERYGLPVDPTASAWQLSVGEQQRVEILKALHRDARILILDEPTAVLTPQEADALFVTMRRMAGEGRAVVFISHKLNEVLAVADRITVLRQGRSVATIDGAGATRRDVATLMVGRELVNDMPPPPPTRGPVVLAIEGVSADDDRGRTAVHEVTLAVHAGELVVLVGVAGNGQRELVESITGLRARTSGSIAVGDTPLRSGDPRTAIRAGIAHVPEDRLGTGVAPSLSIANNLVLTGYRERPVSRGPFLVLAAIRRRATALIARYDIRAPGPETSARQLSGGNLQKVVLAREFAAEPRVLVAASPTRGLDVGAIATVHGYLRTAAENGVAVLLVSEDLDEVFALAHRIAVMYEGRVVADLPAAEATREMLGLLMAGGSLEAAA